MTEDRQFCENCGAERDAVANFCPKCGAPKKADMPTGEQGMSYAPAIERRGGAPLGAVAKWSLTIILAVVTVVVVLALIAILIAAFLGILHAG